MYIYKQPTPAPMHKVCTLHTTTSTMSCTQVVEDAGTLLRTHECVWVCPHVCECVHACMYMHVCLCVVYLWGEVRKREDPTLYNPNKTTTITLTSLQTGHVQFCSFHFDHLSNGVVHEHGHRSDRPRGTDLKAGEHTYITSHLWITTCTRITTTEVSSKGH